MNTTQLCENYSLTANMYIPCRHFRREKISYVAPYMSSSCFSGTCGTHIHYIEFEACSNAPRKASNRVCFSNLLVPKCSLWIMIPVIEKRDLSDKLYKVFGDTAQQMTSRFTILLVATLYATKTMNVPGSFMKIPPKNAHHTAH